MKRSFITVTVFFEAELGAMEMLDMLHARGLHLEMVDYGYISPEDLDDLGETA